MIRFLPKNLNWQVVWSNDRYYESFNKSEMQCQNMSKFTLVLLPPVSHIKVIKNMTNSRIGMLECWSRAVTTTHSKTKFQFFREVVAWVIIWSLVPWKLGRMLAMQTIIVVNIRCKNKTNTISGISNSHPHEWSMINLFIDRRQLSKILLFMNVGHFRCCCSTQYFFSLWDLYFSPFYYIKQAYSPLNIQYKSNNKRNRLSAIPKDWFCWATISTTNFEEFWKWKLTLSQWSQMLKQILGLWWCHDTNRFV